MFQDLERNDVAALAGGAILLLAVGFIGGAASASTPTGNTVSSGDAATVRQSAQDYVTQLLDRQRQQLRSMVNQSENLTSDDVGIDASIVSVEQSRFGSLYRVNVSISGTVPSRFGGGTRDISQSQQFYLTGDGRYLFQQPTDLQRTQTTGSRTR